MKTMVMTEQKIHLIKLEKDEEITKAILDHVRKNNIVAGFLNGIGALKKGKIGYFDVELKKYVNITFKEVELLSCMGNIAINKDTHEPIAHIHVVLGEKDGKCIGGHLIEGVTSVTVEIYLVETRPAVYRVKDEEFGLNLLSPKE